MPDKKTNPEEKASQNPVAESPQPEAAEDKASKKHSRKKGGDDAKTAALEAKLADAEKAQAEAKESLLRTAAEYDNFRKRSQKEHEAAFSNGVSHAAAELLPVLDTLEAAANAPTTDEEYKKGVIMTLAKATEVFKKLGIEEIGTDGCPFDPELHNACMQEECDGVESGHITRVMQKGYTLNGRVIRHAVVAVAP